jgi:N-acyl-D-aspartate/D-glutamate deacylase
VHDLVIDGAWIVAGLGAPAHARSLAVKDGRIAAVSRETVDERGELIRDCGRPGRLLREFGA